LEAVLYRSIQQGKEGTKIKARTGTIFEAVEGFFLLLLGHTDQSVQQTVGTLFKVLFSGQVVQQYGLGMFFEEEYLGAVLVCCKWISLAGTDIYCCYVLS